MTLQEKDKNFIWHPFTPLKGANDPILITSAKGVYLYTAEGKKILDAVSSWWVNLHGHSNPVIAKALADQALQLEHVIFAGFTHPQAITLAENLLGALPKNQSKVFFSDNGSTAVEVGLKIAFQYWQNKGIANKTKVVAIRGAYHGDTFGSMSVGDRGPFTDPFSNYLFHVDHIDFPDETNEKQVIAQFEKFLSTGEVGAFIYEPLVQAAAGMRMYKTTLLDTLLALAKAKGVVCIADEVFTGFYRTGKFLASNYLQQVPDIIALSKGITGGTLPLGVTSSSSHILEAFDSDSFEKTFFHGHSYTANPIACAAANASWGLLNSKECLSAIEMISTNHEKFAVTIKSKFNLSRCESLGTILAIEIPTQAATSYSNELRKRIYPHFLNQGILLRPLGNVLYILPPYVITQEELNIIYSAIKGFLREVSIPAQ